MSKKQTMSAAQRKVFDAIDAYWKEHGYGPTLEDIATATGAKNTSSVYQHVERLVAKGFVARKPGAARTTRTIPEAERASRKRQLVLEEIGAVLENANLTPEERAEIAAKL